MVVPSLISLMVSVDVKHHAYFRVVAVCGHGLIILSFTIMKHKKLLSSLLILMQESFWW